jgi:hypothetical protein
MDSVEENAGRERKLTGTTKTARTARNGGFAQRSPAVFFCANREEQRQGEKKMGRGSKLGRARGLSNLKPRRGEGRTWERGLRLGSSGEREREAGGGLGEGDGPDRWAPPVSRQRERRKGEEGAGWAAAQEGGAGFGPKWPKRRKGEREKLFSFLFSKQNFQTLFQMNF